MSGSSANPNDSSAGKTSIPVSARYRRQRATNRCTIPAALHPPDEQARLEALEEYQILDTMPEQVFDDITYLASELCDTPIALITFVDSQRQWFKSRVGFDLKETSRDISFCSHTILLPDGVFLVEDAEVDLRFADNPLVQNSGPFRFYAGVALRTGETGSGVGTLCVADSQPRTLDDGQRAALIALARQVEGQLELRNALRNLERHQDRLEAYQLQLEQANQLLSGQCHLDSLTGVANRSAFDQRLDEEFHRARRYGHSLCLLVIDADHFKTYNDTFGHGAGDEALKNIAHLLEESSRAIDFVARYGGEEFAIILPETSIDGAVVIAERARRAVEISEQEEPMTISIGVAELLPSDESAPGLLARADAALYEAKRSGRNRTAESPTRD